MAKMTEERQGEIALVIVKQQMYREGLKGGQFLRSLGNAAKQMEEFDLDTSKEELEDFTEAILPEVLGAITGMEVSVTRHK